MLSVPENHVNFVYKLDGDVNEIDVFKLAPTLLALGELIQQSNSELNRDGRQIGVNVKPFRKGSFIVDLTVFPHSGLQQLLDMLGSHPVDQVKTLLEWIGLIGGTPIGVVQVIRFIKGKPKTVEQIRPGEFRYTANDDKSITVNAQVHQLLSNSSITNNIYKVYAGPMEDTASITDVKTYIEGSESAAVVVDREDIPSMREFVNPSANPTAIANETLKETIQRGVYLNPKRGSFDGDAKDWSFRRGKEIVVATIKDKEFMERCINGDYRLNFSDLLTVDLLEKQRVVGTEVMKPTYEIIRVTDYKKGAQQAKIDLE
jgi:hypothetical protein